MFSDSLCAGMTRLSDPSSIASQDSPARIQENRRDVVTMTPDEILREVARVRWFHRIDLGNGIVTPGEDNTPEKLATLGMPDDLSGVSVLDIGAWDGFFSYEAERRGARRVLATDDFCWSGPGWGTQADLDLARCRGHSRLDIEQLGVPDLSPATVGA